MEDLSGKQFGPYQIVAPLGEGGMAAVYKAYQPSTERLVALKILPRHFGQDPQFVARFEQEAKILANLQHPHILPVFDYGQAEGYAYIVMPFLQSGTLAGLMRGRPLALAQIRRIIAQVGDALDYAHSRGLIHRDVKPSNVLLDERDNCLLSDFGIAKMVESSAHLTATGGFIGTPAYMSPEQGLGHKIDHRSDIYALGIILYEMATGRVPYRAETPMATVVKHINDPLPIPRQVNPDLPEALERIMLRALAKQPEDRYGTAGDMVQAIRATIPESPEEMTTAVAVAPATTPDLGRQTPGPETPPSGTMTVATPRPGQSSRFRWWLAGAAGLLLVVVVGAIGLLARPGPEPGTPTTAPLESSLPAEAASSGLALYDDFADPVYEGAIDPAKWLPYVAESCQVRQQAGVLAITNQAQASAVNCNLTVARPEQVALADLGVFEARLQIAGDHNQAYLNQGVTFWTGDSPSGGWYVFCGLNIAGDHGEALFEAVDWSSGENGEITQTAPAEVDRWYTVRLEANLETKSFDCFVDDDRLGSVAMAEAAIATKANFERILAAWRDETATGTTYVDEVRFTPGAAATTPSAPAQPDPGSLYDDFEDETFAGRWDPELWDAPESAGGCDIGQEAGVLRFSCSEPDGSTLVALEYSEVSFDDFNFVETRLRLDEAMETGNGAIILKIYTSLERWAECGLVGSVESDEASPYCGAYTDQDIEVEFSGPAADYESWRLVRLEVDPETAAITFLVDGQPLGRYTPPDPDRLKEADVSVELGVYFEEGSLITGYVDEVRIGP
jgi:hypothetical protein